MDRPILDYANARDMMVDGQVRPNKVYDPRILDAMRRLPRERFVPPARMPVAYSDANVPLGDGRVLLSPMVIARMVQTLAAKGGERALVVAAGPGYGAALLAACGAVVTALEENAALLALARGALAGQTGIQLVEGKLAEGWKAGAPYDLILIDGAVEEIPTAVVQQLRAPGGRLVTIRVADGRVGHVLLGEPVAGGLSAQTVFDAGAPVLPGLRKAPGFVF